MIKASAEAILAARRARARKLWTVLGQGGVVDFDTDGPWDAALNAAYEVQVIPLLNDLKTALDLVSGALVDNGGVPVPDDVMRYGEAVRDALQAKDKLIARLRQDLQDPPPDVQELVMKKLDLVSRDALPCRIHEYDGAYRCYAHNRSWGAIPKPDEPCFGWIKPEES